MAGVGMAGNGNCIDPGESPDTVPGQPDAEAENGQTGTSSLRVDILASSQICYYGLHAILSGLPQISEVRPVSQPGCSGYTRAELNADILVIVCEGFSFAAIAAAAECARQRSVKILLVLGSGQHAIIDAVIALPGDGFIMQDELTTACLGRTLERMIGGEIPMPPAVMSRLLELARDADTSAYGAKAYLTAREEQVLGLLAEGLSNKQIARQLHITSHGVKRLVANILAKLHCPNRTLAVAIALRDGIIRNRLPTQAGPP
jgi:DNA-binding NarL/FixJ family response regulator